MSVLLLSHNSPGTIVDAARERGFRTVAMPAMPDMPTPVASHPDMLLFAGFGKLFVRAAHMENGAFSRAVGEILDAAPALGLSLTSDLPSDKYPRDVAFNCAVIGGALTGLSEHISPAIKRCAAEHMIPILNVAQGYTKCSTLIMGCGMRAPVITADRGIYSFANERGVPAYLIPPGGIMLPGYDTGFVGGASFFADGTLFFLGSPASHPAYDIISRAADSHGVRIASLSDVPLFDAGCIFIP